MEIVKEIQFWKHDCMCDEVDEFDQPLECSPFECEIDFCPIQQLIVIIRGLRKTARNENV